MAELFWIRHAPIEPTGRYTGQYDVDAILPESVTISYELPENAHWLISPLKRAQQTAQFLVQSVSASAVETIPELKEQHFGLWEGQFYDDIWKEAEHRYDWSKPELIRPDGGESFSDLCLRVDAFLDQTLDRYARKPVVIVTHAGVIRAALRHAHNASVADALSFVVDCGSVTHIDYSSQKPVIKLMNRLMWEQRQK